MTLTEAFHAVTAAMDRAGIQHALAGGLASNVWVRPEEVAETFDVDFAVATLTPDPTGRILPELDRAGVRAIPGAELQLRRARIHRVVTGDVVIDFVLPNDAEFVRSALARATVMETSGRRLSVLSPEDVFVYKALSKRLKDLAPMVALCRRPDFDVEYVSRWTRRFRVWRFTKRVLDEARTGNR